MLAHYVRTMIEAALSRLFTVATVTGTSGNLVTIRRTGEAASDAQSYPKLAAYAAPANGDECLCLNLGASTLIIGKVSR